ncbi:MAG: hypothetical protein IT238_01805 [Bacteroidia bacterium]|nr:hypothetical protein [Bacteroidia bacterium]MCZ2247710.1 hypothetical protein [Bacteroidia bacterium]
MNYFTRQTKTTSGLPIVALIVFALLFSQCKYLKKNRNKNRATVARVYDSYLYLDDVLEQMPDKLQGQDSINFIRSYAETWARQQVVLHQAEKNLSDEQKDVDDELESYRKALITYAFEKALVQQKLDTLVSNTEIENYYNANPQNFELKDNIIKVIYVKVKKNAPKVNRLKELYRSENPNDRKHLEDYCRQFAENYYLDDDSWLLFNDLLKEVPIETYDKERFLKNNRLIEFSDNDYLYFVNIKGFKIKDSVSPLSFERDNIKSIILNKRKLKLIEDMRNDVYNDALNNNQIELSK